ncbi:MAG: cytochrome c3 family protein [Deltaproteobacteria bacterium]|nr:cytochrome c3 family protein [Deltaproteobacteria bacterium]
MTPRKELKLAYALAVILLVVGTFSYAAFPAKAPEQPIRLMFKSVAGKVMFDHQTHLTDGGYGISCQDCHHHPQEEPDLRSCSECHQIPADGEMVPTACLDCHESDELEDSQMSKRADALHGQCIDCHKEYDAGPVECAQCHVL